MWRKWSLRFRIFLFFAFLTCAGIAGIAGGLFFGARELANPDDMQALLVAGIIAAFVVLGVNAWVWLLFDENVARPVQALSTDLRARCQSGVEHDIDEEHARYLGDLAPAARLVAADLIESRNAVADAVAQETEALREENARLRALIDAAPVGLVACSGEGTIALYNQTARHLLRAEDGLCLGRPIGDCLEGGCVTDSAAPRRVALKSCDEALSVRSRPLPDAAPASGFVVSLEPDGAPPPSAAVAKTHDDLALLRGQPAGAMADWPLSAVPFVVFDTETTGMAPEAGDEIVQIAGVRMLNARVLPGERFDTLVDPGRSIPPLATRIHGISPDMVAGAPAPVAAVARFHRFAGGAVLVAHNAPFDMAFLRRREGEIGGRFDHPVLDTVLLSAVVWGRSKIEHSLDALATRLGVEIPEVERHTAIGDALATAEVLARLIPLLRANGVATLGEALEASRRHESMLTSA